MSDIDERIVSMKFDNKQFEAGAKKTIDTLDELNKGLKLENASNGLKNLGNATKSFSLTGISSGVESIASRFTTLGIVGVTALQNITNSAIYTGKRMISALTIDPIKTGLSEYETKINAIQTILTNTSSKGTTLEDVNKVLAELNEYADKTIYNFAEMTRNIGTFTAAGIDLDISAKAIKGIANLAAGSGSTANQASVAMYQLSQALASGTVKLQDWNSVVNAGMGGELFQKALEKTALSLGRGRNMAVSFRESLQDGWITTDVLVKTLEQFANDEMLVKAATQVKTFTQLYDTMKESVQSGWAVSWEYIIGDKEQATKTLTAISDAFNEMTGPAADARNEMLKFWNENKGRDAIINTLTNAFKGFNGIIKPVKEAFKDIFPPMTGKQLVDISISLENLSKKFKIGEKTANNLKRTFKGLFAIVDIIKEAFSALGNSIKPIFGIASKASGGLLDFTASIGDYLVKVRDSVKAGDVFNKALGRVSDFVILSSKKIKEGMDTIKKHIESLSKIDTSGFDNFTDRLVTRFEPFTKLADGVKKAFQTIADALKKAAPVFFKLATIVGDAFKSLQERIIEALDNADFNAMFDVVNGGLFTLIILSIKKFVDSLGDIVSNGSGVLDGIKDILDGVRGTFEAYQSKLKAGTLMKIAGAIALLTTAVIALSLVDSKKLNSSLSAISVLFAELVASMAILSGVMSKSGVTGMFKLTIGLLGMATSVLILSIAMKNLADMDWGQIARGLVAIGTLTGAIIIAAKALSTVNGRMLKGAMNLVIFSSALLILSKVVRELGNLDPETLTKGLISIGILLGELVLFMKISRADKMGVTTGLGLIALATALNIMAIAVERFGNIDPKNISQGLASIGVVLAELALFVRVTGGARKVITTAVGLSILGGAMLIFAEAVSRLGNLDPATIFKGLLSMGTALLTISLAMNLMPKNMVPIGLGMIAISTALVILSNALSNMGGMKLDEIGRALLILGGSLVILAGAMHLMKSGIGGSAAMLVMAGALTILTPQLKALGSMKMTEIGKGLLALGGAFAVIGVAGLVLAPIVPAILALAGAMALLGVASLAIGAGLLAFSAGLSALAISGTAGAAALIAICTGLLGLIPRIFIEVGNGIIELAKVIIDGVPIIANAFMTVISAIIDVIITMVPKVVNAGLYLLTELLNALADYVPKMVDAGLRLIQGVLQGIADNIQGIVEAAVMICVNFIQGITNMLPQIVEAGFKLMLSFINSLADSVRNNAVLIMTAVKNLFWALIDAAIIIIKDSVKDFKERAKELIESGFIQGILEKIEDTKTAIQEIPSKCLEVLANWWEDFKDMGKNLVDGFIDGIKSKIDEAVEWAQNLGRRTLNAAKDFFDINSPSRKFKEIGMFCVEGLAGGLKYYAGRASDAAIGVGRKVVNSFKGIGNRISDFMDGDNSPVIRPVMDLTDVQNGVNQMKGLLNGNRGFTIHTNSDSAVDIARRFNPNDSPKPVNGGGSSGNIYEFKQYNYSPKPLPRMEIYRQTRNQFSELKGLVQST